jgi:hypothetical protein
VAHSVELLLDPAAEAAVRESWRTLADAGLPSQSGVSSATNRPHITLVAADRIAGGADRALGGLTGRLPLGCPLSGHVVFGVTRLTLARLVVPSPQLIALHAEVFALCGPFVTGGPYPHCRPGGWTPHVTLGRRFTAEQIGAAMALLTRHGSDLAAEAVGLRRWDGDRRVDHLLIG